MHSFSFWTPQHILIFESLNTFWTQRLTLRNTLSNIHKVQHAQNPFFQNLILSVSCPSFTEIYIYHTCIFMHITNCHFFSSITWSPIIINLQLSEQYHLCTRQTLSRCFCFHSVCLRIVFFWFFTATMSSFAELGNVGIHQRFNFHRINLPCFAVTNLWIEKRNPTYFMNDTTST